MNSVTLASVSSQIQRFLLSHAALACLIMAHRACDSDVKSPGIYSRLKYSWIPKRCGVYRCAFPRIAPVAVSLLPSFTPFLRSRSRFSSPFFFLLSEGPLVPRASHLGRWSPGLLVRTLVESRIAGPYARAHIKRTPTRAFTRSSGPAPRNNIVNAQHSRKPGNRRGQVRRFVRRPASYERARVLERFSGK